MQWKTYVWAFWSREKTKRSNYTKGSIDQWNVKAKLWSRTENIERRYGASWYAEVVHQSWGKKYLCCLNLLVGL